MKNSVYKLLVGTVFALMSLIINFTAEACPCDQTVSYITQLVNKTGKNSFKVNGKTMTAQIASANGFSYVYVTYDGKTFKAKEVSMCNQHVEHPNNSLSKDEIYELITQAGENESIGFTAALAIARGGCDTSVGDVDWPDDRVTGW